MYFYLKSLHLSKRKDLSSFRVQEITLSRINEIRDFSIFLIIKLIVNQLFLHAHPKKIYIRTYICIYFPKVETFGRQVNGGERIEKERAQEENKYQDRSDLNGVRGGGDASEMSNEEGSVHGSFLRAVKKSERVRFKRRGGGGVTEKHFNFAGISRSWIGWTSSGKGSIHGAGVSRWSAGAGIATAISFVPFRSEIAYNVEIKRPREPPSRHVSPRSSRDREDGRGKYGNLPTLWHRNSISARCILRYP